MRATTTAADLNLMIQTHIDARKDGEYTWHTDVYLHPVGFIGCNWNVEVNCNANTTVCGANISDYLDQMRGSYVIPVNDATAVPAYDTRRCLAGYARANSGAASSGSSTIVAPASPSAETSA